MSIAAQKFAMYNLRAQDGITDKKVIILHAYTKAILSVILLAHIKMNLLPILAAERRDQGVGMPTEVFGLYMFWIFFGRCSISWCSLLYDNNTHETFQDVISSTF